MVGKKNRPALLGLTLSALGRSYILPPWRSNSSQLKWLLGAEPAVLATATGTGTACSAER